MRTPVTIAVVVLVADAGDEPGVRAAVRPRRAGALDRPRARWSTPLWLFVGLRRGGWYQPAPGWGGFAARGRRRHAADGRACCAWPRRGSTGSAWPAASGCALGWLAACLGARRGAVLRRPRRGRAAGRAISRAAARPAGPVAPRQVLNSSHVRAPAAPSRRPRSSTSPRWWPTTRACRCSRRRSRSRRTTTRGSTSSRRWPRSTPWPRGSSARIAGRRRADAAAAPAEPLLLPGAGLRRQRQRLLRPAQQLPALRAARRGAASRSRWRCSTSSSPPRSASTRAASPSPATSWSRCTCRRARS